jgi:hypothetical protein
MCAGCCLASCSRQRFGPRRTALPRPVGNWVPCLQVGRCSCGSTWSRSLSLLRIPDVCALHPGVVFAYMTMRAVREWRKTRNSHPTALRNSMSASLAPVFLLLLQTVFTSALSGAIGLALTLIFIPDVRFCNAQRRHALLPPRDFPYLSA